MQEVFRWCKDCDLYGTCYDWDMDAGGMVAGPNFLEPACGEGPYKKDSTPTAILANEEEE